MNAIRASILAAVLAGSWLLSGCDYLEKMRAEKEIDLRVESAPTGAVILVNGTARGEAPVMVSGLLPGRYRLIARKDGYREVQQRVTLVPGDRKTVKMELSELTGLVLVHSTPDESDVALDDAFRGKTPVLISDFPAGTHRLKITHPGFFTKDVEVIVKDRTPQLVSVDLTSDSATLNVNSEPAGAAVLVNGSNHGNTPTRIDALPSGELQLEVRLDGFDTYKQTVKVSAGQTYQVDAQLIAQPGDLVIVSQPAKAKIYFDNEFRGESPMTLTNLPPGSHRVRVEAKGFEPDARDVKVKSGGKITEEFRLAQNSGALVLVTEPGGARVLLDGEEQGETVPAPAGMVSTSFEIHFLSPGEHLLQLVRPGWVYQSKKITIEPGKSTALHEKTSRLFIPDIRIQTRDETITGVLLREFASGDLEIERSPGVIIRVKSVDITDRQAIKQGGK